MLEEERDRNMAANNRGHMRPSRSPPFVVVGLLVVICILAFNYWTVSAKNKELVAKTSLLEKEYEATVFKKGALEKRNDVISQDLVGANRKLIEQQKLHATLEERIINLQDENRELKKENDQLAIESHSCRDMLDIVKKNVTETHYQFAELKGVHGDLQKECDVLSQNNVEFHNEKTQLKGDIEICNMELIRCGDAKIALNQTVRELKQQLLLIEQQQHLQHQEQNAMQQQREELQQQQDGRQQQQEDRYSEQQQQQQQQQQQYGDQQQQYANQELQQQQYANQELQQQQYGDQQQQYGNQELQQRQESDQAQQQYQQQQGDENNAGELGRQNEQEDRREEVVNFREPALPAYNFEPKEIQQVNQYDLEPPRMPTDDRYGLERPAFQDYPNPDDQDVNREFPTRQAFPLDNVDKEQDYGNYDELTAALRDQELVDVQREEDSLAQVDGQESEIAASDASHDPPQLPYVLPAYDMPQDMNNQDQIAAQPAEVGDNRLQYQGDTHREDQDRRELDEQGRLPDRDPGMVAMEDAQLEADRQALGGETEQGAEMRRPMLQQPMMQRPMLQQPMMQRPTI
ncbi:mediator of RNA polymerase II transcription subunit 15-like isoform X2 [Ptychodera flava]|uniref:mediator of RNA polymerase II transcription subunit 15-like isoform X2 n=1 Tax=Ptychodera flava TaxID=63121 RepID=UPI003969C16D